MPERPLLNGQCRHPSVIRFWTDDLRLDPSRCFDCGLAVGPDGAMLSEDEDDPTERDLFLALKGSS